MRLIDADAFKEYICNAYERVKHMYPDGGEWARQITEDFCKDIDEQPTIEPQKWTPCYKRVPNKPSGEEYYWCSSHKADVPACEYIVMIRGAELPTALFWDGCHWIDINGDESPVVAWMPFPEPYKGDVTDSHEDSTPIYFSDLYLCDPDKNTECKKTACYRNGGECTHTVYKKYRRFE